MFLLGSVWVTVSNVIKGMMANNTISVFLNIAKNRKKKKTEKKQQPCLNNFTLQAKGCNCQGATQMIDSVY